MKVMVVRAGRRYRLVGGLVAVGALLPLLLAGTGDTRARSTPPADPAPAAVTGTDTSAQAPVPIRPDAPTGTSPGVTHLALGDANRRLALRREGLGRFAAVGVTWATDTRPGNVTVQVRGHLPGGGWGAPRTARPVDTRRGRGGTGLVWLGDADGVEITVVAPRGRSVKDIRADLIDPRTAPVDSAVVPAAAWSGPDRRVAMPTVRRRAEWGADERLMTWQPSYEHSVGAVGVSVTGTGDDYAPADVPRILRALYYFQAVSLGWGDVGGHVFVDRFGGLWEGRYGGLSRAVAGTRAAGTASLVVLGSTMSAAATESAARYAAWKLSLGAAVDPRGTVGVAGRKLPRVYDEGIGGRAAATLRDRAHDLMGSAADPATLRLRLATWRPATATWTVQGAEPWVGAPGDVPVPADYDGDGVVDLATWNPSTGAWTIRNSAAGTTEQVVLGAPGDRPVPADFDGDGRADPAVFSPATATWHIRDAAPVVWGRPGDVPLPADYTGDGRADLTVFRPSTGTWYVQGGRRYRLGESWHIPVPADYDGDGVVEPATYSPVTHRWFVWGQKTVRFGSAGDVPVPGQYDGDGRADRAVWQPPAPGGTGAWHIDHRPVFTFGAAGEQPAPVG